jgi:hypothetical protein
LATWETPTAYVDIQGTGANSYDIRWPHLAKLSSDAFWLTFSLAGDTAAGALLATRSVVAFSRNGAQFSGGVRLEAVMGDWLYVLPWSDTVTYMASYNRVFRSTVSPTFTATESRIIAYELLDNGPEMTLQIALDNRDGELDALDTDQLGANVHLGRGAFTPGQAGAGHGTARRVTRGAMTAVSFEKSDDGNTWTVTAKGRYWLLSTWRAMVAAQGGNPDAALPTAGRVHEVRAERSGFVTRLDAFGVGIAAWRLGAGRARKEDPVSPSAGVVCAAKEGEAVGEGQAVLQLHVDDPSRLESALEALAGAITVGSEPIESEPLVIDVIRP